MSNIGRKYPLRWVDYIIESRGNGDWRVEQEAVDKGLYHDGDVYIVRDGWLIKQDKLTEIVLTYEKKEK